MFKDGGGRSRGVQAGAPTGVAKVDDPNFEFRLFVSTVPHAMPHSRNRTADVTPNLKMVLLYFRLHNYSYY